MSPQLAPSISVSSFRRCPRVLAVSDGFSSSDALYEAPVPSFNDKGVPGSCLGDTWEGAAWHSVRGQEPGQRGVRARPAQPRIATPEASAPSLINPNSENPTQAEWVSCSTPQGQGSSNAVLSSVGRHRGETRGRWNSGSDPRHQRRGSEPRSPVGTGAPVDRWGLARF